MLSVNYKVNASDLSSKYTVRTVGLLGFIDLSYLDGISFSTVFVNASM